MRILNIVLFVMMLVFMVVQYNDPDGPLWVAIYSVPALWALLCGVRPQLLSVPLVKALLWFCLIVAIVGVFLYWPKTPGWWTKDVWWETETAREGMGMMIVLIVLAVSTVSAWRYGHTKKPNALSE